MPKQGFGDLIAARRGVAGLTPDELAKRLGYRSKSAVYRLENEEQEPSVEVLNKLVATLPLSAEELLRAMGVRLHPPAAARLPTELVDLLLAEPTENHLALIRLLRRQRATDTARR